MYLVVGLGNPGEEYGETRHNIGFMVIGAWCQKLGISLKGRRFKSRNTLVNLGNKTLMLLCPVTYMNNSGQAVKACAQHFGLDSSSIVVVHDDLDLPVGRVKVVRGGGPGGHKGVRSVIEHLGTNEFPRVKVGIGRPQYGESIEDFVLSPFYEHEGAVVEKAILLAVRACELVVSEGVEQAMNYINCQNLADKEVTS